MGALVQGMAGKRLTREQMRQGGRDALSKLPPSNHGPPAVVQMQVFQLAQ